MKHSARVAPDLVAVDIPRRAAATAGALVDPGTRALPNGHGKHVRRAQARSWPIWIAGGLCLVGSFVVTLQLSKPSRPPSPAAKALANSRVSDGRSLIAAIKAAGLRSSPNVKGAIDTIERRGSDRIVVKGWAAEVGNGGTPLDVLVFVDGANSLTTQTEGERADIVHAVGLLDAASATNVAFAGSLACSRGQKLMVVAVTQGGDYGYFRPHVCP